MVSDCGRIKSLSYNKTGEERVLTPCTDSKGYLFVSLKGRQYRVHRLVANAFLPKKHGKEIINHKDENKQNNHVENLEWCDAAYNLSYNGNRNRIAAKHRKKIIAHMNGFIFGRYNSISDAAKSNGVSMQAISRCLNGKSKTSCGYEWSYIESSISSTSTRPACG